MEDEIPRRSPLSARHIGTFVVSSAIVFALRRLYASPNISGTPNDCITPAFVTLLAKSLSYAAYLSEQQLRLS